jgi:hypothetical protein
MPRLWTDIGSISAAIQIAANANSVSGLLMMPLKKVLRATLSRGYS